MALWCELARSVKNFSHIYFNINQELGILSSSVKLNMLASFRLALSVLVQLLTALSSHSGILDLLFEKGKTLHHLCVLVKYLMAGPKAPLHL